MAFTTHPLFLGACPHQASTVLDVVVVVVLLCSGYLLPLFLQSVLCQFLLLDTLFEVPLEEQQHLTCKLVYFTRCKGNFSLCLCVDADQTPVVILFFADDLHQQVMFPLGFLHLEDMHLFTYSSIYKIGP